MNNDNSFLTDGVRAMFLSTLAFFLANTLVKQVSHIPAMEVVFFRCAIASIFCFVGLHRAGADWKGSNRKLLFLRGFFGTTALFLFFTTLQNIPLASAMTIQYLSPIFTSVIAIFVLSEQVRRLQWLFYAIAFSGVLLIERFDARISLFFLTIGIVSAFCSGVATACQCATDMSCTQRTHTELLTWPSSSMSAGWAVIVCVKGVMSPLCCVGAHQARDGIEVRTLHR